MFVMMWTSAVYCFWSTKERVDFKYKKLVLLTVIVSFAKPVLGIVFVERFQDKVTGRIAALAIVEIIAYSGLFFAQMLKGKRFFNMVFWKHALSFNIPLIPHYLSASILNGADRIMIKSMVGESEAGLYSLAYSISMIMTIFNTSLMQTIEPWMYKKINDKQVNDISSVAYPLFIIIAFINIVLIALAPEIVAVFAPSTYYDAIYVIPPIAMSVYFMFSYTFFAVFEFYYKKTNLVAIATSIGALLNIILNYFFIDIYGYYAAGYTTLICYMVFAVFHFAFMRKICQKHLNGFQPYSIKIYFCITFVFVILGFMFLIAYPYRIYRYIFLVIIIGFIVLKRKHIINIIRVLRN